MFRCPDLIIELELCVADRELLDKELSIGKQLANLLVAPENAHWHMLAVLSERHGFPGVKGAKREG
jgi:hypothetical protein